MPNGWGVWEGVRERGGVFALRREGGEGGVSAPRGGGGGDERGGERGEWVRVLSV